MDVNSYTYKPIDMCFMMLPIHNSDISTQLVLPGEKTGGWVSAQSYGVAMTLHALASSNMCMDMQAHLISLSEADVRPQ